MKITNIQRLKFLKKVLRETSHIIKPMITTDKKKKENKESCRKFKY